MKWLIDISKKMAVQKQFCILAIRAAMAYLFIDTQLLLIQHFVAEQL